MGVRWGHVSLYVGGALLCALLSTVAGLADISGSVAEPVQVAGRPNSTHHSVPTHPNSPLYHHPGEDILSRRNLITTLVASLTVGISAGAGIGGGGLLVPIYLLVLGISPKEAVPLSKATCLGSAVVQVAMMCGQRHPTADRPAIDYDTALVFEPATLAGTVFGVLFNVVAPSWLILLVLVVMCSFAARKMILRAIAMRKPDEFPDRTSAAHATFERNETRGDISMKSKSSNGNGADQEAQMLVQGAGEGWDPKSADDNTPLVKGISDIDQRRRKQLMDEEAGHKWGHVILLMFTMVVLFSTQMLKGGHGSPSPIGIQCGSLMYWACILGFVFWVLVIYAIGIPRLVERHRTKLQVGYPFAPGDLLWEPSMVYICILYATIAGVTAGFAGIGGGMFAGPILIELGMPAGVQVASTSFMILFTATSTTAQYLILGALELGQAGWYVCVGMGSAFCGRVFISRFVGEKNSAAYVVVVLAFVLITSAVLMGALGVANMVGTWEHKRWDELKFTGICHVESIGIMDDGLE